MLVTHGNEVGTYVDDLQVVDTPCLGVLLCMCRRRKGIERRGTGIGMWKKERIDGNWSPGIILCSSTMGGSVWLAVSGGRESQDRMDEQL